MKKLTTEDFIIKAKLTHGDKYDYSLAIYSGVNAKIKIICKLHGEFKQSAKCHINGYNCTKCSNKYKKDTAYYINQAKIIHGELYDYTNVNYKNTNYKIEIICKIHGIFKQSAKKHLNGQGCPICKNSKGELAISKILKLNNILYIPQYTFKDCKNILPLPFDFYLPNNNICIEYNGKQHYEINNFFGGEESFTKQIIRVVAVFHF